MTPSERERLCGDHECDRPYWRGRAERAEAAARDFAKVLGVIAGNERGARLAARIILDYHPSFSGEEGTEG